MSSSHVFVTNAIYFVKTIAMARPDSVATSLQKVNKLLFNYPRGYPVFIKKNIYLVKTIPGLLIKLYIWSGITRMDIPI